MNNSSIRRVRFGSSVSTIGKNAFANCSNLKEIEFSWPYPWSYELNIESEAFTGCSSLEEITFDKYIVSQRSCKNIGANAFKGCVALKKIDIPVDLKDGRIGPYAFSGCTSLTDANICAHSIDYGAFFGCINLKTIKLNCALMAPNVFIRCDSLEYVYILSESISPYNAASLYDYSVFVACANLKGIIFTDDNPTANNIIPFGMHAPIYVHSNIIDNIKKHIDDEIKYPIYPIESISLKNIEPGYGGVIVGVTHYENPLCKTIIEIVDMNGDIVQTADIDSCTPIINNLKPDSKYTLRLNSSNEYYTIINSENNFSTIKPMISWEYESTQTTITIKSINVPSDATVIPTNIRVQLSWEEPIPHTNCPYLFSELRPGNTYRIKILANYGDYEFSDYGPMYTKDLMDGISVKQVTPTTVILHGTYFEGDATITNESFWFYDSNREYHSFNTNNPIITGLIPNQKYSFTYNIDIKEGHRIGKTIEVTTPNVNLTTLTPKCVSSTCAVVAAETNLSELETKAGFEWKKYDAPESLAPSRAYACVSGGMLEGRIKNLQPTSYYRVRAFFEAPDSRVYYGDWITFDPSDFSYFEPTTHTYPAQSVNQTSATLKGYALAGTDDITAQGFQYWPETNTQPLSYPHIPADIITVEVTGQLMSADIVNLTPGTTYSYRTFATTKEGTIYGEEQSFTTDELDGVTEVTVDDEPEIIGYYDINGCKHDSPFKGLNIVIYSNGTARKVLNR